MHSLFRWISDTLKAFFSCSYYYCTLLLCYQWGGLRSQKKNTPQGPHPLISKGTHCAPCASKSASTSSPLNLLMCSNDHIIIRLHLLRIFIRLSKPVTVCHISALNAECKGNWLLKWRHFRKTFALSGRLNRSKKNGEIEKSL